MASFTDRSFTDRRVNKTSSSTRQYSETSKIGTLNVKTSDATQIGSNTNSVSVTGMAGTITTSGAALAASSRAAFNLVNPLIKKSSTVQLTIQEYGGTFATNGFPVVNGAIIGNAGGGIIISLENHHPSNALSGYVRFSYLITN